GDELSPVGAQRAMDELAERLHVEGLEQRAAQDMPGANATVVRAGHDRLAIRREGNVGLMRAVRQAQRMNPRPGVGAPHVHVDLGFYGYQPSAVGTERHGGYVMLMVAQREQRAKGSQIPH